MLSKSTDNKNHCGDRAISDCRIKKQPCEITVIQSTSLELVSQAQELSTCVSQNSDTPAKQGECV